MIPATLFALAASAQAQATKTTETKVGVSTKGVEVTRKHTTKTAEPADNRSSVKVVVDGEAVNFPDQGPVMRGNRVLVPLRGVFEKMGATVNWNRANNTVTANGNGRSIVLPLGGGAATVEGKQVALDQPPIVLRGRALVPLRFLSESLGATVDWRASDMTVTIKSGS
jgi:hypothetical protein